MPVPQYLTDEEIAFIHDIIIRLTGGEKGIKHEGLLNAIPAEMNYATGINHKAAVMARGIIQGHVFHDGNKRTGHACMEAFINRYGKVLTASDEIVKTFTKDIAQGKLGIEKIIIWIENHTRKVE